MNTKVVVDKDALGWGRKHRDELSKHYSTILEVGNHPDLPQRKLDKEVASYCENNECDLLTHDRTAYDHYFEAGMKTVQITEYGWDEKADKRVYLIKVIT